MCRYKDGRAWEIVVRLDPRDKAKSGSIIDSTRFGSLFTLNTLQWGTEDRQGSCDLRRLDQSTCDSPALLGTRTNGAIAATAAAGPYSPF